jgi:hypothetical protein
MISKKYDVRFLILSLYLSFICENRGIVSLSIASQSAFLI